MRNMETIEIYQKIRYNLSSISNITKMLESFYFWLKYNNALKQKGKREKATFQLLKTSFFVFFGLAWKRRKCGRTDLQFCKIYWIKDKKGGNI